MTLASLFFSLVTTAAPAQVGVAPEPAPALRQGALVLAQQEPAPAIAEPPAEEDPPPNERGEPPPTPLEEELIEGRRRPDIEHELPDAVEQVNPGAIRSPPPEAFPSDHIPIPDRWRLIQSLGVTRERWWDPYNQPILKGDRPLCIPTEEEQARRRAAGERPCRTPRFLGLQGHDWFFVASAVSDTVFVPRSFPIPVGVQIGRSPFSVF